MDPNWVREQLVAMQAGRASEEVHNELMQRFAQTTQHAANEAAQQAAAAAVQQATASASQQDQRALIESIFKELQSQAVDSKLLRAPQIFSGKDEDWREWSYSFRSLMRLMKCDACIQYAERMAPDELKLADFTPEIVVKAGQIQYLFSQACRGKAMELIQLSEEGNGLQSWARLMHEYQPKVGGRFNAMLTILGYFS